MINSFYWNKFIKFKDLEFQMSTFVDSFSSIYLKTKIINLTFAEGKLAIMAMYLGQRILKPVVKWLIIVLFIVYCML